MTSPTFSLRARWLTRQPGRMPLVAAAAAALLLGVGVPVSTLPVEIPVQPPARISLSAPAPITTRCWVPGDLVGESNPAEVAATLCGVSS